MNSPPQKCGNCSFRDRWLLHNVRLRGEYRRLCTSCVLKLYPGSFCAVCFNLFEASAPNDKLVVCQKCPSATHPSCVPNSDNVSKPYTCPPCNDPNFRNFDVKRNSENRFEFDLKSARALLCAARIAAESMAKAVRMAEGDAIRRVKEAVASKRRAKESLEELCAIVAREKAAKIREDYSAGGSGSGVGRNGHDSVHGRSSDVRFQNSSRDRAISNGNSNTVLGDEKRGNCNGNAGNGVSVGPMNADGGHGSGSSSHSSSAEDGE